MSKVAVASSRPVRGGAAGAALLFAALASHLLTTSATPFAEQSLRASEQRKAVAPLIGNECQWHQVRDETELRHAFIRADCAVLDIRDLTVSTQRFDGPNGPLPLQVLSSPSHASPRRVIISVVGGPGGEAFEMPHDRDIPGNLSLFFEELVRQGDVIVNPAYAGTAERSFYPDSDLPLALAELEALIADIRARFPEAQLIVRGTSLGGYLAASLSNRMPDLTFILHSPLLSSPRDILAWMQANSVLPPEFAWVTRRLWTRGGDGAATSREQEVRLLEAHRRFFGTHLDHRTTDFLNSSTANTTIIFSRNDARIGPDEIRRLRPRTTLRIVDTGAADHFLRTRRDHEAAVSALRRAFACAREC